MSFQSSKLKNRKQNQSSAKQGNGEDSQKIAGAASKLVSIFALLGPKIVMKCFYST